MSVLRIHVPPDQFSRRMGDNGAYSVDADILFELPYGSTIEIEDTKNKRSLKSSAADWKERGEIEEGRVYLPLEYFVKQHHGV